MQIANECVPLLYKNGSEDIYKQILF